MLPTEFAFHPPGEFIDVNESIVYLVGRSVWKIYPRLSVALLEKYQRLTSVVGRVLDDQEVVITPPAGGRNVAFAWRVVPVDEVFSYEGFAATVSEHIPGPTLLEEMQKRINVDPENIGNVLSLVSEQELLRRCRPLTPFITPVNVKPDFESRILHITDVCPYVGTVKTEEVDVDAILARYL